MRTIRPILCAGGLFAGMLATVQAQPGALDVGFFSGEGFNGAVRCIASQPEGGILVGGDFTTFNGVQADHLVRLKPDGAIDGTFRCVNTFNREVRALAIQPDGMIIAAGAFRQFGDAASLYIARIQADGLLDGSFGSGIGEAGGVIHAVAVQPDGGILIGGDFSDVQGRQVRGLARLDPDGSVDGEFNSGEGFNGDVKAIVLEADGDILVGGSFTSYNGEEHNGLVRLRADGEVDVDLQTTLGATGSVNAIKVLPDGRIVIGGAFTAFNGSPANGVAMITPTGDLDASFSPNNGSGTTVVHEIIYTRSSQLIILGDISEYAGAQCAGIVRIGLDGYIDYSFYPGSGFDGPVFAASMQVDDRIIAAGDFAQYNGNPLGRIALIDACTEALWHADADGDGLGDAYSAVVSCRGPEGFVDNGDDCNDQDAAVGEGTIWYSDLLDNDGFGDPGNSVIACAQPLGYVANALDCFPALLTYTDTDEDDYGVYPLVPCGVIDNSDCNDSNSRLFPGAVCDDGDPNTINDVRGADCVCAGALACTDLTLEVSTDDKGSRLEWGVYDYRGNSECSTNGFPNHTDRFRSNCCIQDGEHMMKMRLTGAPDGFGGSYLVRYGDQGRIVHNETGFPRGSAKHGNEGMFSLPMGTDRLVESRCDLNALLTGNLIALGNPGVQAEVVVGNWTNQTANSGYEFWIFDPDGGYDKVVFQSLRAVNGQPGGPDYNARWLRLNGLAFTGDPLPLNRELNVRVRTRVLGVSNAWGPACRLIVNADPSAYWPTHLVDLPGDPAHSCNISSGFDAVIPVNMITAVAIPGGARYRYQWTRVSDGRQFVVERGSSNPTANRSMALSKAIHPYGMPNWPVDEPIPLPGEQWLVRVATKKYTAAQYGAFGPACSVTFQEGVAKMVHPLQSDEAAPATFIVWPNPNQGRSLNMSLTNMDSSAEAVSLDIHDATGRLMMKRTVRGNDQRDMEVLGIDLELDPGAYIATVNVGGQVFNQRLVVE